MIALTLTLLFLFCARPSCGAEVPAVEVAHPTVTTMHLRLDDTAAEEYMRGYYIESFPGSWRKIADVDEDVVRAVRSQGAASGPEGTALMLDLSLATARRSERLVRVLQSNDFSTELDPD